MGIHIIQLKCKSPKISQTIYLDFVSRYSLSKNINITQAFIVFSFSKKINFRQNGIEQLRVSRRHDQQRRDDHRGQRILRKMSGRVRAVNGRSGKLKCKNDC